MVLPISDFSDENIAREAIIRTELLELTKEIEDLNKFRDYFLGNQALVYGSQEFRDMFGPSFEGFKDNWSEPVVTATSDKLEIIGIQIGRTEDEKEQYQQFSEFLWDRFLDNDIDEKQEDIHEGVLVEGRTCAVIWPDPEKGFTIHWNPAQVMRVRYDDDDPDKIIWAVKRWQTPTGAIHVTYYTPQLVYKYTDNEGQGPDQRSDPARSPMDKIPQTGTTGNLRPRQVFFPNGDPEPWPLPNPFNEVPVIEWNNRRGKSEVEKVIPLQDAVNYVWTKMLVAGEFQAWQQRVMMTSQAPPKEGWSNSPGRVWLLEPIPTADGTSLVMPQVDSFPPFDPSVFIKMIDKMLSHIANQTKTPVRDFLESDRGGRGDAPSGEALKIDDKPLLDKVRKLSKALGNRWYWKAVRLGGLALLMNPRIRPELNLPASFDERVFPGGEVLWRDLRLEYRSAALAEAQQMAAIGVPQEIIWEEIGFTPEQINRMKALAAEEPDTPEPVVEGDGEVNRPRQDRTGPRPSNL